MSARLVTDMRVRAHRLKAERAGCFATVIHHGAAEGAVLVKVNRLDGSAMVFDRWTGVEGDATWSAVPGEGWRPEAEIDAYLQRRLSRDPDLWAVEVENPAGSGFMDADIP